MGTMIQIQITCDPKLLVNIDSLTGIQGDLKSMAKDDFNRLVKSFEKDGIDSCFHVWNPNRGKESAPDWHIIDGHGRVLVLRELIRLGTHSIDGGMVPCTETFAESIDEARRKVLKFSSQYHKITREGLWRFSVDNGIDVEELRAYAIPQINVESFKAEFFPEPITNETKRVEFDVTPTGQLKKIYEVVISCTDEHSQRTAYEKLVAQGYECKVLSM
jgi:hypothetical protein